MPRYFFDIDDGVHITDVDGTDLADRSALEAEARKVLFDVARVDGLVSKGDPITVTVRNETGAVVYRAKLNVQAGWISEPPQGEAS